MIEYKAIEAVGFICDKEYYIYDRFSNNLLKVSRDIYKNLDDFLRLPINELEKKFQGKYSNKRLNIFKDEIKNIQENKNSLISYKIPKISISDEKSDYNKILEKCSNYLTKLIINTTEDCNLRCEYCIYSGKYVSTRKHNPDHQIKWEVVKKAIDLFLNYNKKAESQSISFYGGEPLLNFPLIQQVITYVQSKNKGVSFYITTNATLLKEEIAAYLINNGVNITISIDGPKIIHDQNRKFADCRGSFDTVWKNIQYLKKNYYSYFSTKLAFSVTLSPSEEDVIKKMYNFFTVNNFPSLSTPSNIRINFINPSENSYFQEVQYNKWVKRFIKEYYAEYCKIYTNNLVVNDKPLFQSTQIHQEMMFFHHRSRKAFDKYKFYWPNGSCLPGMRSIFISSDGTFFPCEKLYDKQEMPIGDINNGININTIYNELNESSKALLPVCGKCWAYRLCGECWTTIREKKRIQIERRTKFCSIIKENWLQLMDNYIKIIKSNSKAFDCVPKETLPKYINDMIR